MLKAIILKRRIERGQLSVEKLKRRVIAAENLKGFYGLLSKGCMISYHKGVKR